MTHEFVVAEQALATHLWIKVGAAAQLQALEPGAHVGKYELIRRLAIGGMAEVHLARAIGIQGFEKQVVLKRILPQFAHQRGFVRMFLDEARLAATLHHPNIVQVFDIGEHAGNYYFAMEYLRGRDVREILSRAQRKRVKLPLGVAISIGMGVCAGLHYAHDKRDDQGQPMGIVHRDVSPSNIIVTRDGASKVLDFGVAKAASHQSRTRAGTLKGKISYMSPEQCRGEALDRASDVFAIGILLFEMTTGTRLFKGGSELEVLNKIASEDAPTPAIRRPDYPAELEQIVARALSRDKLARYRNAQDLQRDLERFARHERLATSPLDVAEFLGELFPDDFPENAKDQPAAHARGKRKLVRHSDEPSVLIVDCFADEDEDEDDLDLARPGFAGTAMLPGAAPPPVPMSTSMFEPRPAPDGTRAAASLFDPTASGVAEAEGSVAVASEATADSVSALLAQSQQSLAALARAQSRARWLTGLGAALVGVAVGMAVFAGGSMPWAESPPTVPAAKAVDAPATRAAVVNSASDVVGRGAPDDVAAIARPDDAPVEEVAAALAAVEDATDEEILEIAVDEAEADLDVVASEAALDEAPAVGSENDEAVDPDDDAPRSRRRRGRSRPSSRKTTKSRRDDAWNPDSALLPGM